MGSGNCLALHSSWKRVWLSAVRRFTSAWRIKERKVVMGLFLLNAPLRDGAECAGTSGSDLRPKKIFFQQEKTSYPGVGSYCFKGFA